MHELNGCHYFLFAGDTIGSYKWARFSGYEFFRDSYTLIDDAQLLLF